ncbi:hypothetical protein [Pontimicrobium sp. IMCC45349]|uniref:hypothetical protein n=1 Tax=Pontimicrobium sp. IMCC45349 TaxID=3391574 RepID=UPI0039A28BFA
MEYKISINQLADFSNATESKKKRILKQQKKPNPFLIPWYQLAKSRIKKVIVTNGDLKPIELGIEELKSRIPKNQRQSIDKQVSIEALRLFKEVRLPQMLKDFSYEIVKKGKIKSIYMNGVEVIISPDVIYRVEINGRKFLGGVKLHVAKGNIFDNKQLRYISTLIYKYLNEVIAQKDEEVLKDLCLSLDVFGQRVISAPNNIQKSLHDINRYCDEIKTLWSVA